MTLANNKNYQKMLKEQEEAISNLKKARAMAKKELYEAEKEYHLRKREHSAKMGKFLSTF